MAKSWFKKTAVIAVKKEKTDVMILEEQKPMTAEEKKRDLYLRQKKLLATFLEHGAISQAQHDQSLRDLTEKMGMEPIDETKV